MRATSWAFWLFSAGLFYAVLDMSFGYWILDDSKFSAAADVVGRWPIVVGLLAGLSFSVFGAIKGFRVRPSQRHRFDSDGSDSSPE